MKRVLLAAIIIGGTSLLEARKPLEQQPDISPSSLLFMSTLEQELSNPEYAQTILPNNFSYLTQILEHCISTHQPRAYVRSVFKLFGNLIKGSQYVNAYAFSTLLAQLPPLLQDYFVPTKSAQVLRSKSILEMNVFDRMQETMSAMIYTKFSSRYDYFTKEPEKFLDELSSQLFEIAQEEVSTECLRQTVVRFLEATLGKLIWSPYDQLETWNLVKHISNQLVALMDCNIIDDVEDFDDLCWSLVHRFCFFIDVAATELSLEYYEHIKRDLAAHQLVLFELEEQADFIETKADRLLRAIMTSEAQLLSAKEMQS